MYIFYNQCQRPHSAIITGNISLLVITHTLRQGQIKISNTTAMHPYSPEFKWSQLSQITVIWRKTATVPFRSHLGASVKLITPLSNTYWSWCFQLLKHVKFTFGKLSFFMLDFIINQMTTSLLSSNSQKVDNILRISSNIICLVLYIYRNVLFRFIMTIFSDQNRNKIDSSHIIDTLSL